MGDSRLGTFIIQHRYRVDPGDSDRFWPLMATIRDHQLDLGVASFEIWQDANDPWQIVETVAYDSWSHRQRLDGRSMPPVVEEAIEDFGRLVVGGWDGIETREWDPCEY